MEIPPNITEKLKCSECDGYFSYSVILKNCENKICGNCAHELNYATKFAKRQEVFKQLVSLYTYPCCFKKDGCTTKLSLEKIADHEQKCKYRRYTCPMSELNNCIWFGKFWQMKRHFETSHSTSILTHPTEFQIDTRNNYENYFLVIVYNLLFLLQVKCNINTDKLWYCVRLIGDSNLASKFHFDLKIKNEEGKIKKKGRVESIETLMLSQRNVLEIDINSLIDICSNLSDDVSGLVCIKFNNERCLKCLKYNLDKFERFENNGYICKECQGWRFWLSWVRKFIKCVFLCILFCFIATIVININEE